MIILRQKEFISQAYHDKIERRVGRRAVLKTVGDAAIGGVKNAGLQTLNAIRHPLTTAGNVAESVSGKVGKSITSLGATFGIGKDSQKLSASERVRRITHFASPVARKAINIHDVSTHTLGKNGEAWVDSMARFKYTPLSYIGRKTDELARTGVLGMTSKVSGLAGASNVASGLDKAQSFAGGKWAGFNADRVAGAIGKSTNQLTAAGRGVINTAGKAAGYTIGERPGGFVQSIGDAITKDYEPELEKAVETFKNTKQARRVAAHINKSRVIKAANKVARADKRLWKGIGEGTNTIGQGLRTIKQGIGQRNTIGQGEVRNGMNIMRQGVAQGVSAVKNEWKSGVSKVKSKMKNSSSKVKTGAKTVLTGLGSAFKKRPTLTPVPARI